MTTSERTVAVGPDATASARPEQTAISRLLGPAFVAAIAYVDPGNVAANLTAGVRYGYLLVWVLVISNVMAVVVQYLSAKLGAVTGRSLPELLGSSLSRPARLAYLGQGGLVAIATDLAEVIGGAIALQILFDIPLVVGGLIVGAMSMAMLAMRDRHGQRTFEQVVIGLLLVITIGFVAGLLVEPPHPGQALGGLVPRFQGSGSVLIAVSMLGATVMPHAVYLHSALVTDRHGGGGEPSRIRQLLRASRWDVVFSLLIAGSVNIAMLLLAATHLPGVPGTDTIQGAHAAVAAGTGPVVATLFAVGLLASGLASASVGSYAGASIMSGLLKVRMPLMVGRLVTLVPAIVLLAVGADPTWTLVLSQVALSLGLPFALFPLVVLTGRRRVMGEFANGRLLAAAGWAVAGVIVVLNMTLLGLLASGRGA